MTDADLLPTASDHAANADPTTGLCANYLCRRCMAIRQQEVDQR